MKKIVFLIVFLFAICINPSYVEGYLFKINIGFDRQGEISSRMYENGEFFHVVQEVKSDFCGSVDVPLMNKEKFIGGLGAEFQFPKNTMERNAVFHYVPIYSFFNLIMYKDPTVKFIPGIYLVGKLGYNLFYIDRINDLDKKVEGGLYYGFGIGFSVFDKFLIEGIYSVNEGNEVYEIHSRTADVHDEYKKITIYFGIRTD